MIQLVSSSAIRIADILSTEHVFRKTSFFRKTLAKNRNEILSVQNELFQNLLTQAITYSPFYRDFYSKAGIKVNNLPDVRDIKRLPIVHKQDIKKDPRSFINESLSRKKFKEFHSSGSTGNPKTFYENRDSHGWRMAALFNAWERAGYHWGRRWLRIGLTERNTIFSKISDKVFRCSYTDLSEFDERKLQNIVLLIENTQPEIIRGYASALFILSRYLLERGTKYGFVNSVISQGDILFPDYRGTIEDAFGCKVFDTYGGDGVVISGQCSEGSYHINNANVIVEVVDDNGISLPVGKRGHILVTNLHNHVMPLIRYEIGDMGILTNNVCSCGEQSTIMAQPQGRDTDIIRLSNGIFLIVHFFTVLFSKHESVEYFQVTELGIDHILIKIQPRKNISQKEIQAIEEEIEVYARNGVKIQTKIVDKIPLEESRKRRFVISKRR